MKGPGGVINIGSLFWVGSNGNFEGFPLFFVHCLACCYIIMTPSLLDLVHLWFQYFGAIP